MVQLVVALALLGGSPTALVRRIPIAEFPFQPITGLAVDGNRWLVGGLRGLALGRPGGTWKMASDQAVKQILPTKDGVWVLYGNGSVDKVDIKHDRLYFDVLSSEKRPWVGSMAAGSSGLAFGGYGGWIFKCSEGSTANHANNANGEGASSEGSTANHTNNANGEGASSEGATANHANNANGEGGSLDTEETYPSALQGRPVTSICEQDGGADYAALPGDLQTPSSQVMPIPLRKIWMGTQDGLFLAGSGPIKRIGLAAGLPDLWVTSLVPSGDSMIVGMKAGGLAVVRGSTAVPLAAPSKRVESLLRWRGHLVLGTLDGAWIRNGDEWELLATGETTFLAEVRGELVVGGIDNVRLFSLGKSPVLSLKG